MDKYKLMIVDDEADVREGVVARVDWDALGFEVVAEADNGQDALEKAEPGKLDVVLTDIKMPFMDGLEMSARLSQMCPGVKLVILSGFDEFEYAKAAIKLNVVEYVLKPVNVAELTEVLQRVRRLLDDGIEQRRDIDTLRERYKKSLPLMRERFLTELMWGAVPDEELYTQLSRYGMTIGDAPYRVAAVFEVDRGAKTHPRVAWELVPVSVMQIVEEQLDGLCRHAVFISSSAIIAVTAWDDPNPIETLTRAANEVCLRCMRVLEVSVTAGIGRCHTELREVHDSFIEARSALEYKVIAGSGKPIYIHDMERVQKEAVILDSREEDRLMSVIKFGSPEQLRLSVADILGKATGLGEWERQAYILNLYSIVYRLTQRYELLGADDVRGHMLRFMKFPHDWNNSAAMREWLYSVCSCMGEYINEKRQTASRNLADEAKRFIEANYQDHSLSVDRLCEHLHVSQSYFSTVFKQETGTSYVQYLTELRLDRAIELLQQTDEKTYEIARRVGYEEPNYFSYVFKKRFGVSPTNYRKR